MNLVLVQWRDACNVAGWHSVSSLDELVGDYLICTTVGLLYHTTETVIVLATTWGSKSEHDIGGVWVIPRGMVLRTEILRKVEFDG